MDAMILPNDKPYNNEFKKEESHNMDEMEKAQKGAKDEKAEELNKKNHGGEH